MTLPPTVLLTGAASGIGRATALLMAASGWRCVLVDMDAEGLARLESALTAAPQTEPTAAGAAPHRFIRADLTNPGEVERLAADLPPLDALINNAGRSDTSGVPLVEQPPSQLDRLLDLNLHAPRRLVTACLPNLRPGGRIVNVASGAGLHAIPWRGAYSPSKAGLIALTEALAAARPDLTVNALCPGFVSTELVEGLIAAGRLDPVEAVSMIPLGRMAAPAEMAHALHFLASTGAGCLRGQALSVDGGTSVYGGSRRQAPATLATLPLGLPLALTVQDGNGSSPWAVVGSVDAWPGSPADDLASTPRTYEAVLDPSPLDSPDGELLHAVHAAAARFATTHQDRASLTLLLPARRTTAWQHAGEPAAARMLVATLACEWASRHLRINAVEVPSPTNAAAIAPLLRYLAGASAQYLTGQTLVVEALTAL
jgi:NAD(P)-dependent dehydrogenase (short-subunit alcohol dehydrogenase family)